MEELCDGRQAWANGIIRIYFQITSFNEFVSMLFQVFLISWNCSFPALRTVPSPMHSPLSRPWLYFSGFQEDDTSAMPATKVIIGSWLPETGGNNEVTLVKQISPCWTPAAMQSLRQKRMVYSNWSYLVPRITWDPYLEIWNLLEPSFRTLTWNLGTPWNLYAEP